MFRRLTKEESGLALPLAIGVMVIVGVMGAGLLVFVNRDLESVIEVNRGQKAFEIAEAGVASARQQQLSDVVRRHYDRDITNDCFSGQIRATAEDWSPNTTIYSNPKDCSSATTTRARPGVTRNFAGGAFNVTIECFNQKNDNVTNDPCAGAAIENAPEDIEASKRAYFKVTSTGYFPADGSGAVRTVQSIVHTNRLDVPTAYYTPGNIEFNGGVTVSGVSFFAGGNITHTGGYTVKRCAPPLPSPPPAGCPALYRDWDTTNSANFTPTSDLNTQPRRNAAGVKVEGAGFGAEGSVEDFGGGSRGVYDYDSTTSTRFVRKETPYEPPYAANAANTISYPFNPDAKFDLALLEQVARSQNVSATKPQGNFYEGGITILDAQYPDPSSDQTVFYVKANGGTVTYKASHTPVAKGLIVVENGNFKFNNASNGFDGVVIVTGNGSTTGSYESLGNDTVKGFAIAAGTMKMGGTVDPLALEGDYTQRPGFYNMKQWSWRECYSKDCS